MDTPHDLNIEEVLEHWDVEHALREIIANALDEQYLSGSVDIEISEDPRGGSHIRDHGRGLEIEHFTLNENEEKTASDSRVIGKFGVGLKDAVATSIGTGFRSRSARPLAPTAYARRASTASTRSPRCTSNTIPRQAAKGRTLVSETFDYMRWRRRRRRQPFLKKRKALPVIGRRSRFPPSASSSC